MIQRKFLAAVLFCAVLIPSSALAQATGAAKIYSAPKEVIEKIKDEGMNRSQAMPTLGYLTDVIGARLTGSPQMKRANEWTRDTMTKWGLQNAVVEPWGEFGRGWELKRFSASIVAPEYQPFRAYPKAWSPSTPGAITGDVVYVEATDEAGLEKYRGKLKGAIVLTAPERAVSDI